MSPEISLTNQVRWREALELLRTAAATPGYSGPAIEDLERVAGGIADVRGQVQTRTLEEQARRASRPRRASRGEERAIRKAIAEVAGG